MRRSRRAWPIALAALFLIGIGAGWLLNPPDDREPAERPSAQRSTQLTREIREAEREVEAARRAASGNAAATAAGPDSTEPSRSVSPLSGLTIAVDPGHNGGNASHPTEINRPVPSSNDGSTKACNTTGTQTDDGRLAEARFNFEVARQLKKDLRGLGASVRMTRDSNKGVGPCVDERAEIANRAGAAVLISIHADGDESPRARGFHVIRASPSRMVDSSLARPSLSLAKAVRDALVDAGVPTANYVGKDGIDVRDDLAGLNLARVPAILVELGNMRSAEEAEPLESPGYRSRLARALAKGLPQFFEEAQL